MRFDIEALRACRFLVGPTACGKSEVGLFLAERVGAEIVALDSMSLYRGMDVGTAKPSREARKRIPHHLIDVLAPHEEYSVADYIAAAETVCRRILDRGRIPLFVGGTGLYLRALLRGVFDGPPADWEFRRSLETEANRSAAGFLHRRLAQVDPAAARAIHPNDGRRIIRALEVYHVTGRPLSAQQQHPPLPPGDRPEHVHWLLPPREWLYERINRRVDGMIAGGLVDEVRRLLSSGRPLSRTAGQALGYKEIIDHLEGRTSLSEAIDLIRRRTRQFAKRQHTWFRNLEECTAVPITGSEAPERLADRIASLPIVGPV